MSDHPSVVDLDDLFSGDVPVAPIRLAAPVAVDDLAERAAAEGWRPLVVDLTAVADKAGMLERFAVAAAFPGHVGRNWDALQDALGDLGWLGPADGYVLVLVGWDAVSGLLPVEAGVARSVLVHAAREWADRGTPWVTVLA